MTGNKEFGKPTDGSPGKNTVDRERKFLSKISVSFTEDKLLFSWWKRSSIINLLSSDCHTSNTHSGWSHINSSTLIFAFGKLSRLALVTPCPLCTWAQMSEHIRIEKEAKWHLQNVLVFFHSIIEGRLFCEKPSAVESTRRVCVHL